MHLGAAAEPMGPRSRIPSRQREVKADPADPTGADDERNEGQSVRSRSADERCLDVL